MAWDLAEITSAVTSALVCVQWVTMVSVVAVWTLTSVPVIHVCRVNSAATHVAVILVHVEGKSSITLRLCKSKIVVMLMLVMEAAMISTNVPSTTEHVPMDVLTTKEAIPVDVKIVHSKSETGFLSLFKNQL